jgi:S-adenosylmethionine decarboxylase
LGSNTRLAIHRAWSADPASVSEDGNQRRRQTDGVARHQKDYFIERDGVSYAGTHLIVDLWDAHYLDDLGRMERALREAVVASGATLLHIHLHHFEPNGGISGVAVLAESHISVHSWPERGYAAIDAFMCGEAEPERCVPVFEAAFNPGRIDVATHLRGRAE